MPAQSHRHILRRLLRLLWIPVRVRNKHATSPKRHSHRIYRRLRIMCNRDPGPQSRSDDSSFPPSESLDALRHNVVRQDIAHRWRLEYADFVSAHNATIEAEGLPLDAWRTF